MKTLILIISILFFMQQTNAQGATAEELASGLEEMIQNHAGDLQSNDLRLVRRNLQEIRLIFADYGIQPNPQKSVSQIFTCSDDFDPILKRTILSSIGEVLREDELKVFGEGTSSQGKDACQAELSHSTLGTGMRGVCVCTDSFDPLLKFQLVDQSFKTVKSIDINVFSNGTSSQGRRACEAMVENLSICTGL